MGSMLTFLAEISSVRISQGRCSGKKVFLKSLQYSQQNTLLKRDSNTGVFL